MKVGLRYWRWKVVFYGEVWLVSMVSVRIRLREVRLREVCVLLGRWRLRFIFYVWVGVFCGFNILGF